MVVVSHSPIAMPRTLTAVARPGSVWHRSAVMALLAGAAVLLGGCNRSGAPKDTQVAVRVNKEEISVHQLQAMLQRQPRLVAAAGDSAPRRALDALIDQELAAQAAHAQGIDAEHDTIQWLEAARRETLARAYHERLAAKVTAPSSDEVDRYYESHPGLFAERRIYILEEQVFATAADQTKPLAAAVAAAQSREELAKSLRDLGVTASSRVFAQSAEDLPLALVEPLRALKPGQSVWLGQADAGRVLTVVQAQAAPVDRRSAAPAINNFILADRKRQASAEAVAKLRDAAKIEYLGSVAAPAAPGASATR